MDFRPELHVWVPDIQDRASQRVHDINQALERRLMPVQLSRRISWLLKWKLLILVRLRPGVRNFYI